MFDEQICNIAANYYKFLVIITNFFSESTNCSLKIAKVLCKITENDRKKIRIGTHTEYFRTCSVL